MISFIIKALQHSDSVFIDDLGTFCKQYQSARFEGDNLLPPQYAVILDTREGQLEETSFIDLICREKQCRITEAAAELTSWVAELKNALANNSSISFDNFGTFTLDSKGNIQFVCDRIDELNREFEGMEVVRIRNEEPETSFLEKPRSGETDLVPDKDEVRHPEPTEEPEKVEESLITSEPAPAEEPVTAEETEEERLDREMRERMREAELVENKELIDEPVTREEPESSFLEKPQSDETDFVPNEDEVRHPEPIETSDDQPKPKRKRRLWWLWLLLCLIALGVLAYLFRNNLANAYQAVKDKFARQEAVTPEESEPVEETVVYEEPTEDTTAVDEEPQPYTPEVVKTTADGKYSYIKFEPGHYYAIAGSLPNEQNAELHIRQRGLDKYSPTLLKQDGVSNLRVCIGVFDTEEEAETYAKSINPKYWVLK